MMKKVIYQQQIKIQTSPKPKTSVFIIGYSMIKKIDGHHLISSLKPFSTVETTELHGCSKLIQKDFERDFVILKELRYLIFCIIRAWSFFC